MVRLIGNVPNAPFVLASKPVLTSSKDSNPIKDRNFIS